MKYFQLLIFVAVLISTTACLRMENAYTKLPPGPWRAVLQIEPSSVSPNPKGEYRQDKLELTFDEVNDGQLPFNFEVVYTDDTTFHVVFLNGEERIRVDDISFGRSKDRAKDSIRIDFPVYDTYLVGLYEEGIIEGHWVVNYRNEYRIPFTARFGEDHRFTKIPKTPDLDLTGTWEVTFGLGGDDTEPYAGIGEFEQVGNELRGTFRTETGDYRYMDGEISGSKAYLSVFDGAHAFLFEARIDTITQKMVGSFRSGKHYRTVWEAEANDAAVLTSPYELTRPVDAGAPIDFAFPNTEGDTVRLSDAAYDGRPKLVQIMGTWCPNCKDETKFLLQYFKENPQPELAVMTIGFERYREADRALAALQRYRDNNGIPYPVLWGGYHDKQEASATLPMLSKIISYPTLLFIDRDNRVRKIHTGFNGPATSKFEEFRVEFEQRIAELISES